MNFATRMATPLLVVSTLVLGACQIERSPGEGPRVIEIDGKPVPEGDLYPEESQALTVRPIGVVSNDRHPGPGAFGITGGDTSEIHLYPGMSRFMKGLEAETSLLILWQFDRPGPIRSVFVRGWDGKEVGPFASRTCNRPTPIGVTVVELLEVDGTRLVVRGLDAYDNTPVLDIKVSMESLRESGPHTSPPPSSSTGRNNLPLSTPARAEEAVSTEPGSAARSPDPGAPGPSR